MNNFFIHGIVYKTGFDIGMYRLEYKIWFLLRFHLTSLVQILFQFILSISYIEIYSYDMKCIWSYDQFKDQMHSVPIWIVKSAISGKSKSIEKYTFLSSFYPCPILTFLDVQRIFWYAWHIQTYIFFFLFAWQRRKPQTISVRLDFLKCVLTFIFFKT